MLSKHSFNLEGRICQKSDLIGDELFVKQVCQLEQTAQDVIEVTEKQSNVELKAFLRRCLDAIDFLRLTTDSDGSFYKILQELDPNMLEQLASYRYKDIVNSDSNPLVRKMLEITIRVQESGDTQRTSGLIRRMAHKYRNLC